MEKDDILRSIYEVILERKANPSAESYTSSLMAKGIDSVLKKVGEEASELIIAGKGGERRQIVHEAADLVFHTLVLLGYHDIDPAEVCDELRRRFGTSGFEEKSSRKIEN
jgi:phosphoribosyl-ATP pyrophosphohydrolase